MSDFTMPFIATNPASISLASLSAFEISPVHIAAPRPNSVSLAIRIVSSSLRLDHRRYRPKNLLPYHQHILGEVRQNGRLKEKSLRGGFGPR